MAEKASRKRPEIKSGRPRKRVGGAFLSTVRKKWGGGSIRTAIRRVGSKVPKNDESNNHFPSRFVVMHCILLHTA